MTTSYQKEQIQFYLKAIKDHDSMIKMNHDKLMIFEGELEPYVKEVLKKSLSPNYYKQIEHRTIPINVLTRIIEKLSKVYSDSPLRVDENYQDFIDQMKEDLMLDVQMSSSEEYSHLFKCYALEPFLDEGKPGLRSLPFDRFLVIGEDENNPLKVTTFIKYMGKKGKYRLFYAYTADEFIPFTEDGEVYSPALDGNDGVNPYGVIPFVYGNRSKLDIVPVQDTDVMQLALMIPILMTDLGGAIMFNCFSVIYGIDLVIKEMEKSPNAFWDFKSDSKSDKEPKIGTIKSDVDISAVIEYVSKVFVFWLETKGVRVGSLNGADAGNVSGIAKIIDEMDVYEVKKKSITYFKAEEKKLWNLLAIMNNFWFENAEGYKGKLINLEEFNPKVTFQEPRPEIPRSEEFDAVDKEYKGGYMPAEVAIATLYPDLDEKQVQERAAELERVTNRGETTEGKNQDPANDGQKDSGNGSE